VAVVLALGSFDSPPAQSQEEATPAAHEEPTSEEPASSEAHPADGGVAPVADAAEPMPSDKDARAVWLTRRASAIIDGRAPQIATARVGVAVLDATTGSPLYLRDSDGRYNLASVTKLITSSAALSRLGPDFRWRTAIYAERFDPVTGEVPGDLYVRGRGDPMLTSADLRALARDLRRAGVRNVRGSLVFDGGYFDDITEPPRFADQPKERAGFRAPIAAFAVDGNVVTVVVEPEPTGWGPAAIRLEPPGNEYVALERAEVTTIATGRTRMRVDTRLTQVAGRDQISIAVSGQLRFDEGTWDTQRRIDDPVRFASEVLRAALGAEEIRLGARRIRKGEVPLTARVLAVHESPALADVVREMNKQSNNFIAETLLKTLGAETRATPGPATWDDGLAAVRAWLVQEGGLVDGSFRIENGSGLFSASELTPVQVTQVLLAVHRDFRVGPDLMASLAVLGVDGTLRRRLSDGPARGRVRAKTGTLASVSALSGYVALDGRRPLAFAILVNDIPNGQRGYARLMQDALLETFIAYLDGS